MSETEDLGLIWGATAIARELGIPARRAFYLLERGYLPAKKVGDSWVVSRHGLRQHFAAALGGEAA